jgi:HTH-type transcriptional regulator/antitoxin MqsA
MKCPSCAGAKLVRDTRDIQYTYKGETTTIPAVRGDFCPACGDSVLAAAESSRVSAAILEFNKQVNASMVDPGFIARARKKLALERRRILLMTSRSPLGRVPNCPTRRPKSV